MATESSDPQQRLEHDTEELDERIERLGEQIGESRGKLADREEDAQEPVEDVGGDWEDTAAESPGGEDPATFDDPEELDTEEEEE